MLIILIPIFASNYVHCRVGSNKWGAKEIRNQMPSQASMWTSKVLNAHRKNKHDKNIKRFNYNSEGNDGAGY